MIDPLMTPNEYRMLARRIRETARATRKELGSGVVIGELVKRLADYYEANDPSFDRAKFMAHAGVKEAVLVDEEKLK